MRFGRKQEFILDLVNEEIGQLTADVEANDGKDIMGFNVQGAEGQDTMGARAIARAEQAAEKLRLKKERRAEKIMKLRAAEAERKAAEEEAKKKEIEDKMNQNKSKAAAAGAAAADAMAAAGNAAKAAFGKLKFW